MTRRTQGPKRNAEAWARRLWPEVGASEIREALIMAWMAGYRAAARARRIARPKPRKRANLPLLSVEERDALAAEFKKPTEE